MLLLIEGEIWYPEVAFHLPFAISHLQTTSAVSSGGIATGASGTSIKYYYPHVLEFRILTLTISVPRLCDPELVHIHSGIIVRHPVQLQLLRVRIGFEHFSMQAYGESGEHRNCLQLVKFSNVRGYGTLE
jgi:hypothetical protein